MTLDKGKRLVGIHTFRQQQDRDGDDGQGKDRGDAQRRENHQTGQSCQCYWRMTAPVSPGRGFGHIHKVQIIRHAPDVFGCAFDEQRVTDAHDQFVQLPPDILIPPMHGQRINAVAPPQAHCTEAATHHLADRGDQHLDCGGLDRRNLIDAAQFLVALQAEQLGDLRAQHHPVTDLQFHPLQVAAQRRVAADDVDQTHTFTFEKLHSQHLAPDQVAVGGDHGLGKKLHLGPVRQHARHAGAVGQEIATKEPEIKHAPGDQNNRQRGNFKDRKRLQPLRAGDAIDQQVGRGPDQRERATQDGSITEWDQQL